MAINFPSSPSNNQLFVAEGKAMRYVASKGKWKQVSTLTSTQITDLEARTVGVSSMSISGNTLVIQKDDSSYANVSLASFAGNKLTSYANASILPLSDLVSGTQVYVEDTDSLYITDGSGWYKIATVNLSPSLTLGVSSISLGPGGSVDVNYTVNEPEDTPYTISASSTSNATITVYQANNTITFNSPVQNTTETITITATDGVNSVGDTLTMTVALLVSDSKYTALLATAIDTSNNSTITDSSSNARSVTISGNPNIGTFSPYRNGGYSLRNGDDTNDRILIQDSINIGQDFTMEAWIFPDFIASGQGQIINQDDAYEDGMIFQLRVYNNGELRFPFWENSSRGSVVSVVVSNAITSGKWQHIVVRRISSTNELRIFVDGVSVYSNSSYGFYSTGRPFAIGGHINRISPGYTNYHYPDPFHGYIADVRVSNTSSIYTGTSFTPPTERLTASSSTLLLACNDQFPFFNYKTGSGTSTNIDLGQTGSATNSMKSAPAGPYNHSGYSASDNGGSVYFDGNGDYLTIPSLGNSSVTDFTVSFWIYPEDLAINNSLYPRPLSIGNSSGANGFILYWAPDRVLRLYTGGAVRIESTQGAFAAISLDTWHHVVIKRNSGTWRMLINGVSQGTYSSSSTIDFTSSNMYIGRDTTAAGYLTGYVSDFKIEFSSDSSTSLTPPTSPTSSSGADLHIISTDADILDKAQASNIKIIGNTTGSTTQAKFASTKSMYFDGNGDGLELVPNDLSTYHFESNDFTIEAWVYTSSSTRQIIANLSHSNAYGTRFQLSNTNRRLEFLLSSDGSNWTSTYEATTGAVALNTWTHVALVRNGNDIMMFKDGTQVGATQTFTSSLHDGAKSEIGIQTYNSSYRDFFSGYIQDLRVTKGLARYTSSFTPPTSSLQG